VDGTPIEAWASMKRFAAKDGSGKPSEDRGRNPTVDFKGEPRANDTHASKTDPDARRYKKGRGRKIPPELLNGKQPPDVGADRVRDCYRGYRGLGPLLRVWVSLFGAAHAPCPLGHALMENRSGLVVDAGTTHATGTAEREAAKLMVMFLASKEWIVRLWDGLYNVLL